jgi:Zn-finger nucleic acid-binding protein
VAGRGYFRCPHCETCHFPETLPASADGIVPLGEASDQPCPVCSETLSVGAIEGHEISFCETCRGVLTTNSDFPEILRERRAKCRPSSPAAPLNIEELARQVDCPGCGQRMETHPYHGGGNAVIDTCMDCQLIWFDASEIAAIAEAPQAARRQAAEPTLFSRFGPSPTADSYGPDGLFLS